MNILVTAIGSMSAECVLSILKKHGHFVVGCDIYPKEWHYESKLCDLFFQAPVTYEEDDYISFLLCLCIKFELQYIIPLTDLEIDVINKRRKIFEDNNITLCMQNKDVLNIVRNKYILSTTFEIDNNIPSIKTQLLSEGIPNIQLPCIAKPFDGRSSEGLLHITNKKQLSAIEHPERYIIQEYIDGSIYTVDYCRSAKYGTDAAIPRKELLRTKNGAGLTIQTIANSTLIKQVSYLGKKLNINGCVNMEFIFNKGVFYLIDINPRFSAGVAFSVMSGYDMVSNHLKCFNSEAIDTQPDISEQIIIKKFKEVFI